MKELEILKFKEKLLNMEKENIELKHKYDLEELNLKEKFDALHFDRQRQTIRIKSAEISKSQMRGLR